jgi:dolichol-phosphate mannosyltransferase
MQVFFYGGKINPVIFRSRMVTLNEYTQRGEQQKNQQYCCGGMVFQRFSPYDPWMSRKMTDAAEKMDEPRLHPVAVAPQIARAPRLCLVIPTLGEAGNVRKTLDRIRGSLDPLDIPYQLIVVDDDSGDGTEGIVQELSGQDPRIHLVVRRGERGLAGAIVRGWQTSPAEILGAIDGDLQHPPELLTQLWGAMNQGYDIVVASRYAQGGGAHGWNPVRYLVSRLAVWMTVPLQRPDIFVRDPMSGFFLVRRTCIDNLSLQKRGFKILLEILVRGKVASVAEVPFTFGSRLAGKSKASLTVAWDYLLLLKRLSRQKTR